ncbi:AbrB/MazE/SpoVT family DNA-binding domain-containing protein [Acidianus sp. HS-5]|uniref:AbrB/MazE/SpoVT family DNA-binding domain-containing protein n=1 Tax=Acidianus sp. HS-5 TaxID=2886040 RepID=UPI001F2569A2|nr:AbrB/MazE/SpoVT family DNA-binding domain-containing protein [Acidianus sp. HS-5]BDC17516.1 AbrB family transcriptional regulator [Acidianus sp. HS-5]
MEEVVIKKVDEQGRIVIPKEWRTRFNTDEFIMVLKDDKIEIYPKVSNLSKLIDSVEVDELTDDWHELKRKIYRL